MHPVRFWGDFSFRGTLIKPTFFHYFMRLKQNCHKFNIRNSHYSKLYELVQQFSTYTFMCLWKHFLLYTTILSSALSIWTSMHSTYIVYSFVYYIDLHNSLYVNNFYYFNSTITFFTQKITFWTKMDKLIQNITIIHTIYYLTDMFKRLVFKRRASNFI